VRNRQDKTTSPYILLEIGDYYPDPETGRALLEKFTTQRYYIRFRVRIRVRVRDSGRVRFGVRVGVSGGVSGRVRVIW